LLSGPVWALQQGFRMLGAATKLGADQAPLWTSLAPVCRRTTMSLATSFSSKFPSPAHWDKSSNGRSNSRWLEVADVRVKYVGTSCASVASSCTSSAELFMCAALSSMQVSHRSRGTRSIRAAAAASATQDRSDLQPGQMHRAWSSCTGCAQQATTGAGAQAPARRTRTRRACALTRRCRPTAACTIMR